MPHVPMTPQDVLAALEQRFPDLSPELQRAARWVQQHSAALGLQSMRTSAREAGVAPTTMARLAQTLGFEGFEALRQPFKQALAQAAVHDGGFAVRARAQQRGGGSVERLQEAQGVNVQSWVHLNTTLALDEAADQVLSSNQVLFLGLRASHGIAHHLHYTSQLLRGQVRLAHDGAGAMEDQVADLRPGDLLVAVSQAPYTRRTVELAQRAHDAGVPVLALTDHAWSPLARLARHTLLFRADSPSFFQSMTGAQALAEALVSRIVTRGGADVLDRLTQRQAQLQEQRTYWEKPLRKAPT